MKSVDTNVLARFLLNDDAVQSPIAEDVLRKDVQVSLTVLLEVGWLLGSRLKMPRQAVNLAMRRLLDMSTIHVENEELVRRALTLHEGGADLADVIHLVAARGTEALITFDHGIPGCETIGVPVEVLR